MSERDAGGGEGALATWRDRIAFLENELARSSDAGIKFNLREQIEDARREVKRLTAYESLAPGRAFDVGRVDRYAPAELVGRQAELALLEAAWHPAAGDAAPNVLCVVALGGEGKTSLAGSWLATLAGRDWDGASAAFAWSFYSQGTREHGGASSDLFLSAALRFFGDGATADSSLGPYEKGHRLARLVGARRALLVLDGLEPLQYPPTHPQAGRLTDPGVEGLLKGLAALNDGLCVVTTRYRVEDLNAYVGKTVAVHDLVRLSPDAGVGLLRSFGLHGAEAVFRATVERVRGHALALTVLGAYARDAFGGDVAQASSVDLAGADEQAGGHAFRVIDAYASWLGESDGEGRRGLAVLRVAGLFDRPVAAGVFEALVTEPAIEGVTEPLVGLAVPGRNVVLSRLERARLVTVEWDGSGRLVGFDAHPLVREFFASRLRAGNPPGWRVAHGRVYEHLCSATVEGPDPSFEALAPLYQAIVHGCHADRHQGACVDVYWDRICQGNRFYSTHMLGAVAADLGAVACFFSHPWDTVHCDLTPPTRAWLLNEAGTRLQRLGRLTDAVRPLTAGLDARVGTGDWVNASASARNVCELWLADGDLARASAVADAAVEYAEQADDPFHLMGSLVSRGAVRFRLGDHAGAVEAFTLADHWHHQREPGEQWMYSLAGFWECEVAGAEVELAAWQHRHDDRTPALVAVAGGLIARATHTREIARRNGWIQDVGWDSVTITRARLWTAILTAGALDTGDADQAVTVLRQANDQGSLAVGLLGRSHLRHHIGELDGARADLDEVLEISGRGPMRLHLCDTMLLRAHLFHDNDPYPWDDPAADLDEVQRLIDATSYHHRQLFLDHTRTLLAR